MAHTPRELAEALTSPADKDFWEALGRFVSAFAITEANMQVALRATAGLRSPVAEVLFSGTRIDAAATYIKRIGEAKKWPRARLELLDNIFNQLGEITRLRNDILHYGAIGTGPDRMVSNRLAAYTENKLRVTRVSVEVLDAMTADLSGIWLYLALIALGWRVPAIAHASFSRLNTSWRYKPERQQGLSRNNRPTPRKPKRPPQSSQA